MKLPILIAMVLYMAMVIWIGVIYSKKTKTSEDYFLGGRGLGPWVTAMSAEASDMSRARDQNIGFGLRKMYGIRKSNQSGSI